MKERHKYHESRIQELSPAYRPFNWAKALHEIQFNYTQKDAELLSTLASNWVTCACGKADPGIERDPDSNVPLDGELERLGKRFMEAIDAEQYDIAHDILKMINTRAANLLS